MKIKLLSLLAIVLLSGCSTITFDNYETNLSTDKIFTVGFSNVELVVDEYHTLPLEPLITKHFVGNQNSLAKLKLIECNFNYSLSGFGWMVTTFNLNILTELTIDNKSYFINIEKTNNALSVEGSNISEKLRNYLISGVEDTYFKAMNLINLHSSN